MTARSTVLQLAAAAGILPGYQDALGGEHHLGEDTAHALLRAMGFETDSPSAIEHSLHLLDEKTWGRLLEPVTVLRGAAAAAPRIRIALPAARAGDRLDWLFAAETGEARDGTARWEDLARVEERDVGGTRYEARLLELPFPMRPGYHEFAIQPRGGGSAERQRLIVAPERCYLPPAGAGRWGIALQLYSLRSQRNWGLGDFTDLAEMARIGGRLGAATLALNPLHAMFPERPGHLSPYSPSHRQFLALRYLDVAAIPDFEECEAARRMVQQQDFQARLAALRAAPLIDYDGVASAKRPILELLYDSFREHHLRAGRPTLRGEAFRQFQRSKGEELRRFALFQVLSERFAGQPWRDWPEGYRDPGSREARAFAEQNADRLEYFEYLQWQATLQLSAAADAARQAGMEIGLYRDLALAPDSSGAEIWANPTCFARGVSIGAPPDVWNPLGQSWGLPPFVPSALRHAGYAPFAAVLRANMTHRGALRIDHAMGLERLFWIPEGGSPRDGAYVRYPVNDLFAILALESARAECLVIGEDLGTLPPGFHERMQSHGVLSYRLFYFSQDERGEQLPPEDYPALAAVTVSTHDLATLAGYWAGRDLEVRGELALFPSVEAEADAKKRRAADRRAVIRALKAQRLLPPDSPDDPGDLSVDLVEAVHRFLARTPTLLLLVSLEDLLGEIEQVNMPGTVDTHPNWRRKMRIDLDCLADEPSVTRLVEAIVEERARHAARIGAA